MKACEDPTAHCNGSSIRPCLRVVTRALQCQEQEMTILTEVTRILPALVSCISVGTLRGIPLSHLMTWLGEMGQHRIASSLLIETGAVEACVRAASRRPECSSFAVATSRSNLSMSQGQPRDPIVTLIRSGRLVRGWLKHSVAAMAIRDPADQETIQEVEADPNANLNANSNPNANPNAETDRNADANNPNSNARSKRVWTPPGSSRSVGSSLATKYAPSSSEATSAPGSGSWRHRALTLTSTLSLSLTLTLTLIPIRLLTIAGTGGLGRRRPYNL